MKKFVMGIDEAGRGPVLGAMVYGTMYCALDDEKSLKTEFHVSDSKKLTKDKRDEIMGKLSAQSQMYGACVRVVTSEEISSKMLRRRKYNLNLISHDAAMDLIRMVRDRLQQDQLGELKEVYVDTVGDPAAYQYKLEQQFPGLQIVVAKKADALYPVVSAASIVAKVTRDELLNEEALDMFGEDHKPIGSGYPGDASTKSLMEEIVDNVFGYNANLVRISWSTSQAIMDNRCCEVEWSDGDEEEENGEEDKKRRYSKRKKKAKKPRIGATPIRDNTLTWETFDVFASRGMRAVLKNEWN